MRERHKDLQHLAPISSTLMLALGGWISHEKHTGMAEGGLFGY